MEKALGLILGTLLATALLFIEISGIPLTPDFQSQFHRLAPGTET